MAQGLRELPVEQIGGLPRGLKDRLVVSVVLQRPHCRHPSSWEVFCRRCCKSDKRARGHLPDWSFPATANCGRNIKRCKECLLLVNPAATLTSKMVEPQFRSSCGGVRCPGCVILRGGEMCGVELGQSSTHLASRHFTWSERQVQSMPRHASSMNAPAELGTSSTSSKLFLSWNMRNFASSATVANSSLAFS